MNESNIYLETLEFLTLKDVIDAAYKAGVSSGFNDRDQYIRELEDCIVELESKLSERPVTDPRRAHLDEIDELLADSPTVKDCLTVQTDTPPDITEGMEEASHE